MIKHHHSCCIKTVFGHSQHFTSDKNPPLSNFSSIKVLHGLVNHLIVFIRGGGPVVQALGHLSATSSTGALSGEWVLDRVQVEGRERKCSQGKKKKKPHKTWTYNNINRHKVVVELGWLTQFFIALDNPPSCWWGRSCGGRNYWIKGGRLKLEGFRNQSRTGFRAHSELSAGGCWAWCAGRLLFPLLGSQCHAAPPAGVVCGARTAARWRSPAGRIPEEAASCRAGVRSFRHGAPAGGSVHYRCRGWWHSVRGFRGVAGRAGAQVEAPCWAARTEKCSWGWSPECPCWPYSLSPGVRIGTEGGRWNMTQQNTDLNKVIEWRQRIESDSGLIHRLEPCLHIHQCFLKQSLFVHT